MECDASYASGRVVLIELWVLWDFHLILDTPLIYSLVNLYSNVDPARVTYDPLSFLFRRFRSFPSDDFSCWTATCSTFEPVYNSNPTTDRYSLWRNGSSLNVLPFVETPEGLLVETIYTNKGIRTNLINGSPMEITRHCFMTTALSFSSGASEIQLGSPGKCPGHPCAVGKPAQINELEMSENYK